MISEQIAMTVQNSSKTTGSYRTVLTAMTIRELFAKLKLTLQSKIIPFLSTRCPSSANLDLNKFCDAEDCGKKISGLYFRELPRRLLFSKQITYLLIDCCECDEDNFDLCLKCAMGGRTCHDISHVLSPNVCPIERIQQVDGLSGQRKSHWAS